MQTTLKTLLFISLANISIAQVGISDNNSAPHSSAQLDVKSTTKAFYPPRMTTVQKNAIASVQPGATVFDITLNQLSFYNGTSWVAAAGAGFSLPYNQSVIVGTGYDGGAFKVTNTYQIGEAVALNGTITGNDGFAIRAMATNTAGFNTAAIYATNSSTNSNGVGIHGSHAGGGVGIRGGSSSGAGVSGSSTSGIGVSGFSTSGIGVKGVGLENGVKGESTGNGSQAVRGDAAGTDSHGVYGEANGNYGIGVYGNSNSATSGVGVWGNGGANSTGVGTFGFSFGGKGIYGNTFNGYGVYGSSDVNIGGFFKSANGYALITETGNVGIGVSNPSTILDIKSRIKIRHSAETSGIYFDGTTNTYKGFLGMETDNLIGFYGFNGAEWAAKMDNTTGEWIASKGLSVGGGTKIGKIIRASVALDISSITTNTVSSISLPFIDAQIGDQVMVTGSGNLAPAVIGNCYVSTPGFVNVFFINNSNVNVDPALMNYLFTIIR